MFEFRCLCPLAGQFLVPLALRGARANPASSATQGASARRNSLKSLMKTMQYLESRSEKAGVSRIQPPGSTMTKVRGSRIRHSALSSQGPAFRQQGCTSWRLTNHEMIRVTTLQPRSGGRMQPTVQAVGRGKQVAHKPGGAKRIGTGLDPELDCQAETARGRMADC